MAAGVGAAFLLGPTATASASCVAFNGRTSADGKCEADAGSVAVVLGTNSVSKAAGRGSFALTVGNGSGTVLAKGDRNFGVTIGQRSTNSTTLDKGGNRQIVLGDDSLINNTGGGGNTFFTSGPNNQLTSLASYGNRVRVFGSDNRVLVDQTSGRNAVLRGNAQSVTIPQAG